MGYVQIIELRTSRWDEVEAVHEEWLKATEGKRTTVSETVLVDRDDPGRFSIVVEFPDEAAAAVNDDLPETARFAAQIEPLLDGPPTFRNMDVVRVDRT